MNDFADVLASEWVKIRSVRSTYWNLIVLFALVVGLALLFALLKTGEPGDHLLIGTSLGVVAAVALGALVITAEYSTGMIRTSLMAVPRRIALLSGKAVVLFGLIFAIGALACLIAYLLSRSIHPGGSFNGAAVRAIVGGGLYLAVTALLTFALGVILRQTAGVITIMLGLLFVAPIVASFLPPSIPVADYLPGTLGQGLMSSSATEGGGLGPWPGFFVYCGYTLVLLAAAFWLAEKRDA